MRFASQPAFVHMFSKQSPSRFSSLRIVRALVACSVNHPYEEKVCLREKICVWLWSRHVLSSRETWTTPDQKCWITASSGADCCAPSTVSWCKVQFVDVYSTCGCQILSTYWTYWLVLQWSVMCETNSDDTRHRIKSWSADMFGRKMSINKWRTSVLEVSETISYTCAVSRMRNPPWKSNEGREEAEESLLRSSSKFGLKHYSTAVLVGST